MPTFRGPGRGTLPSSNILLFAALVAGGLAGTASPSRAQCVITATDATCTNSGNIPGNLDASLNAPGTASVTNSGSVGGFARASINGAGTATLTNSGSVGSFANININGPGTATLTNSGSLGGFADININGAGTATLTNSGSVGGSADININGPGTATFTNSGSVAGSAQSHINGAGTATLANSGSVGGSAQADVNGSGTATLTNSGSIADSAQASLNGNGTANVTNSGFIGGGAKASVNGAGTASVTNFGTIADGASVGTVAGTAILTNHAGSRIIGSINLGGPTKQLNFVGGNYLYTLNSLAGVTINTHGAPFVVSGNTVAVLDPTVLALEDRSLMNFTGAVSSMLQDRFGGMAIPGGAGRTAPLSFASSSAPDTAARLDAAHDAFAGLPSLSMSYASDGSRVRNANAAYLKAPVAAVPVYDTTVWASGFGGERRQSGFDAIQAVRDTAYGGALGVDRQFTPDLRLGLFAGGGASKLRTAFDVQSTDSEYGFAGGYGRWDRRDYFVDFALFGGGVSTRSTRQVANNLVAGGLEIANASYNGWFVSPDVTFGYRTFNALGTVTPKVRVRYVGGTLDGYTETGSAQGLVVGARSISDIEERLGIEFAMTTAFGGGGTIRSSLELSGVGLQRLGDNTINTVLLAQNLAFTTPGRREAYGGVVNAGLDWRPKSNLSLFVSAEAMATNDAAWSAVGKGGVRVGF